MRRNLLFACILTLSTYCYGQVMTGRDLIKLSSLPTKKLDDYLSKQGFIRADQSVRGDTTIQDFQLSTRKASQLDDCVERHAEELSFNNNAGFNYYTTSYDEYSSLLDDLKKDGFYTEGANDKNSYLFQKDDMTVYPSNQTIDTLTYYSLLIKKVTLPSPKNIQYAEDFLGFQSHANLEYVFGKRNVQKDIYYFSDSNVVRCSVLFPNTNRQVIFIWKDELNRCRLSHLLIGNSLRGKNSDKFDSPVSENVWTLRNGLHPNMSLSELIRANNADVRFYGWNSQYPGIVVPAKNGNIDFKNTGVILSCLNCGSSGLMSREVISADEAQDSSNRLFILAVILMPQKESFSAYHK
jgi:hypothetical protein